MEDKDFRATPVSVSEAEAERAAVLAAEALAQARAREVKPVEFYDKENIPPSRPIEVNEAGQPVSPRYDESPELPKDSFVQEPVSTYSSSSSVTVPAPGLERELLADPIRTTAPVEKDSGLVKEPSLGQPTSSTPTPTPPGRPGQPV